MVRERPPSASELFPAGTSTVALFGALRSQADAIVSMTGQVATLVGKVEELGSALATERLANAAMRENFARKQAASDGRKALWTVVAPIVYALGGAVISALIARFLK